ncbi:MAG: restriction endonuclease subunit S [Lachnospiraceae bacterium]|nr:restriction endonuclease subunit S [Lachnospiraceae bacterium]
MGNKTKLLSTVAFSDIQQWDVKQFFLVCVKSNYKVEKLGKHLIHQTTKIQLSDYPDDEFVILGVSNKIGMFDASVEKGKNIKQKYHLVENDWIAYNPYRINVGSIGIKTPELKGKFISPAYVVFSCKETLLPEYLWLMMKSGFFNQLIKDSTTGSVRQTLKYDKLAEIKAPIPLVNEQRLILREYHDTLTEADENIKKGNDFSDGLLYEIQSKVSSLKKEKKENATTTPSIMQTISFSSTKRWEVDYNLKEGRLETIYSSMKCNAYSINQLKIDLLFGLSVKASSEQKKGMIPVLRMSNIVKGEIDYSELKYLPLKEAITKNEPEKWLLKEGDVLINRTNGSKDLVGKAAVFHGYEVYTYASYLIRYRFDSTKVLPEYINIMFMTPLVREQIAVMRRQGGGQYNLNSDEIGAIMIPVPSKPEQEEIIRRYYLTRDGANHFYDKAKQLKIEAVTTFEKEIFT